MKSSMIRKTQTKNENLLDAKIPCDLINNK
jgi:hypothetical protein